MFILVLWGSNNASLTVFSFERWKWKETTRDSLLTCEKLVFANVSRLHKTDVKQNNWTEKQPLTCWQCESVCCQCEWGTFYLSTQPPPPPLPPPLPSAAACLLTEASVCRWSPWHLIPACSVQTPPQGGAVYHSILCRLHWILRAASTDHFIINVSFWNKAGAGTWDKTLRNVKTPHSKVQRLIESEPRNVTWCEKHPRSSLF